MIIQETVDINPRAQKTYWESLGYNTSSTPIKVSVKHLQKSSNKMLLCLCEMCNKQYYQRIYRDTKVCGSCRSSTKMKNNTLGKKNRTLIDYSSEEVARWVNEGLGKSEIAQRLSTTISVVNRILVDEKLVVEPYRGLNQYTQHERAELVRRINQEPTVPMSEIPKKFGVSSTVAYYWKKLGLIKNPSTFDVWKNSYRDIINNISYYKKLNKTKTLKTISEENDISVEQLKRAFAETDTPVILHSYNKSKGEIEVRDFIREKGYECNSLLLERTYEIDCFVRDKKFGVEYCGEYWHRYDASKSNRNYHQNKMKFCLEHDVDLLTIFENEWKYKRPILESMIANRLGKSTKVFARNCKIQIVSSAEAKAFHIENHINGYTPSSINIALIHKDEIMLCLSLSKSRFDRNFEYEITRFSSKLHHIVVGGLSRAFTYFVKNYNPTSCLTYADLRFGIGRSYTKIGFKHIAVTSPNYFYYNKKYETMENRMNYQKAKLTKFDNFCDSKTELQIMEENGYYRIYDCGNNKFAWESKKAPEGA